MSGKNGFFQLLIKNNGTYIMLYDHEPGGKPILYDELNNYLIDKKIYEYDKSALGKALANLKGDTVEIKLMNAIIYPQDESVKVTVSEDRMMAKARFYPPTNNGSLLNKEDIIAAMVKAGIKFGTLEENINQFLIDRRYCTDYILAKAMPAVPGRDAVITYHFNTDRTQKPKTNEDGSVDFHTLDMISHCRKGDVLATMSPVDYGKPGLDICGNVIRPNKVNNRVLRHGNKITMSEDGLTLFSEVDGHVTLTDGRVFVSDTYDIAADVDTSTGDIVYDGNVVVKGNVITGFSIHAKGDVEVYGVVEGAYIEAGGQIILRRGMQGMNKGVLKAAGNIVTKFIENAEVISGGYITTESILHSKVSAKGDITLGGRRGFVTGGEIRSGTMIQVKTAGSQMGTNTLLEVGIDPRILEESRELEKQIIMLESDKEKIVQVVSLMRKKMQGGMNLTADKLESLKQATQTNISIEAQLKEVGARLDELRMDMEGNATGTIKIQDTVFPGTKIVISNIVYHVREKIQHSKFSRDRADIKVSPL